jgi:serine/threonine-protein kinase
MGRYQLIECIGEGGMAEIFFAVAHGAEGFVRHFVVKRMHHEIAQNRIAVDQFIDEAKLQARLVHSNIVPVFDFGKVGDEYFLALEYIHGRDVHQVVHTHVEHFGRPLDVPTAFYILHEVMVALAFAHAQTEKDGTPMDVVHRDVAPGNVLVSYQGEVKLTDFGIAKAERRVSRTQVGMIKGNASFMSPEQARGEVVDQRSDLFSAGLVLYHCLTARPFYRGETPMGNLVGAAIGPGTAQFGLIDQLPDLAARVVRQALEVDPDKRYPTATAVAQDLAPHMGTRAQLGHLMDILFPAEQRRDLR